MQEEDNDDPLRFDQRTLGDLDGPQVHRNHVKPEKDFPNKTIESRDLKCGF